MAIDINFEMLMLCQLTLFFTVAYLVLKNNSPIKQVLGIVSALAWFVLGLTYVASNPTFPVVAMLFFGVGMVFVALVIHDSWQAKKERIWTFPEAD